MMNNEMTKSNEQNILVKPCLQVKVAESCLNIGGIQEVIYGINNVHSCLKGSS